MLCTGQGSVSPQRAAQALSGLRISIALLIFVHGFHRAAFGGIAPFGAWLDQEGIPFGQVVAFVVTMIELLGPLALLSGGCVRPVALLHAAILGVGVGMVHYPSGWFVVGAGRNGMEFSVLLIIGLLAVAWADPRTLFKN